MTIPAEVRQALEAALGVTVVDSRMVYGGDINQAARLTLRDGETVFVKWNPAARPDFFRSEAHGLRELARAGAVRVPVVLAESDSPPFLAMEWIEPSARGRSDPASAERLGRQLALLHNCTADMYGLEQDNYIGSLPQPNSQTRSWVEFFRDQRIGAQMAIARREGQLPPAREAALVRLQEWLPVLLDDAAIRPSLLHGDLWGGNYIIAASGDPVLIDPAVYYGHREIDLAMTELFGGFPPAFHNAYQEICPLDGYEQRRELYQLYPLLVHMNLFGGSYATHVDSVIRRYVG